MRSHYCLKSPPPSLSLTPSFSFSLSHSCVFLLKKKKEMAIRENFFLQPCKKKH